MRDGINWLSDAISSKGVTVGMNHYCVRDGEIRATDGRITAGHPWTHGNKPFLIPGLEFEKVLARLPADPDIEVLESSVRLKSGRFRGDISTLPIEQWAYPDVEEASWRPIPEGLVSVLRALRPFVSDNASQLWALSISIENGWAYATNNVILAGAPYESPDCPEHLLVPIWAVDFLLPREDGIAEWSWSDNYIAFRWDNGAWMRSQVILGAFPEKAAALIREAWEIDPPDEITAAFVEAYERISKLTDSRIELTRECIKGAFGAAVIEEASPCSLPDDVESTYWGSEFLTLVVENASHWNPAAWPKPAAWRGEKLAGYIVGRRA